MHPINTPNYDPAEQRAVLARLSPREAYEDGMPLYVLKRRYHLSASEAQDVAPEEFESHDDGQNAVSGY